MLYIYIYTYTHTQRTLCSGDYAANTWLIHNSIAMNSIKDQLQLVLKLFVSLKCFFAYLNKLVS